MVDESLRVTAICAQNPETQKSKTDSIPKAQLKFRFFSSTEKRTRTTSDPASSTFLHRGATRPHHRQVPRLHSFTKQPKPPTRKMATESNGAPAGAPAPQDAKTSSASAPAKTPAAAPAAAANPEKLTPAQLKAKAKAEKAARRAKVIETKAAVAAATPAKEAGKGKGKQDGQPPQSKQHRGSMSGRRPSIGGPLIEKEKDARSGIPECFSHVPMAKRVQLSQTHKDVDPAVLVAGQQMAAFAIKDSISRLEATLLAFKKVCLLWIICCWSQLADRDDR